MPRTIRWQARRFAEDRSWRRFSRWSAKGVNTCLSHLSSFAVPSVNLCGVRAASFGIPLTSKFLECTWKGPAGPPQKTGFHRSQSPFRDPLVSRSSSRSGWPRRGLDMNEGKVAACSHSCAGHMCLTPTPSAILVWGCWVSLQHQRCTSVALYSVARLIF